MKHCRHRICKIRYDILPQFLNMVYNQELNDFIDPDILCKFKFIFSILLTASSSFTGIVTFKNAGSKEISSTPPFSSSSWIFTIILKTIKSVIEIAFPESKIQVSVFCELIAVFSGIIDPFVINIQIYVFEIPRKFSSNPEIGINRTW